jgi:hypothetical protein
MVLMVNGRGIQYQIQNLCTHHSTTTQEITAGGDGPSSWKQIMNFRI